MSVTLTDDEFEQIRSVLRIIANGRTPNGRGGLKELWAHQMTDLAREVCDKNGWTYDQRTLYGVISPARKGKAA